jgi:hypothetical protein
MILTADDLRPGVRFKYNGHPVEILRGLEKRKDRFGLELDSWWLRRIDTGDEGYVSLGPGGVLRVEPLKTPRAQLEREIAKSLATPIQRQAEPPPIQQRAETSTDRRYKHRAADRKSHAQKKATLLKDIEPGLRNVAQRSLDAENRFIAYAMEHGRLSRGQAETALAAFRKARVIKFDVVNGTFHVKHGQFLEPDVLRRAAGVEE